MGRRGETGERSFPEKSGSVRKSGDPELARRRTGLRPGGGTRGRSRERCPSRCRRKIRNPNARSLRREGAYSRREEEKVLQSAVEKLQAKVTEEIGESDPEARYNLGIAYKEMGLLEEAVQEFLLCRSNPSLFLGASSLLAETLAEKGDVTAAIEALDEVLSSETIGPAETRDVRYQKAVLLSRSGREEEAEAIFLSLYEGSPDYRDLRKRVKKIKG